MSTYVCEAPRTSLTELSHAASRRAPARPFWATLLTLAIALLASGCAPRQTFLPAAHVKELESKEGVYGATYEMKADGQRLGEAQLWSRGVYRGKIEESTKTLVHVGFVLRNDTNAPLRLDERQLVLEDVQLGPEALYDVPAVTVDGELTVPPGQTRDIDVTFALPNRIWPGDVFAYRVRWTVQAERPYAERTAFMRNGFRTAQRFGRYHTYYYDPYWVPYGPYGYFSLGLGWYPWTYPRYYYGPNWGVRPRVAPFPRNYARPRAR